jgi:hypothetical protein
MKFKLVLVALAITGTTAAALALAAAGPAAAVKAQVPLTSYGVFAGGEGHRATRYEDGIEFTPAKPLRLRITFITPKGATRVTATPRPTTWEHGNPVWSGTYCKCGHGDDFTRIWVHVTFKRHPKVRRTLVVFRSHGYKPAVFRSVERDTKNP